MDIERHGPDDEQVSRALLALSVDAAGIGTFVLDVATGALTWNAQMFALLEVDPAGFSGQLADAYAHIHPEDVPRVAAEVEEAIAATGGYVTQYRVPLPGGGERVVSARGRMLTDAAGRPVRLVGAAYDITAERRATDSIRAVLETLAVGYAALDSRWRITYVNAEAERIVGYSRAELLGAELWEKFPEAVGTVFEERYRAAAASGKPLTFDAYYPAPLDIWVEVRVVPEDDGIGLYFLDITARRRAQQQAEQAATRAALLAAVTEQLTGTMDAEQAVGRLAQLVVPALADWCVVTLVDDEGALGARRGIRDVGWWHREESSRPLVEAYCQHRISALQNNAHLHRVLATGRPAGAEHDAAGAIAEVLRPGSAQDLIGVLAPGSFIILPLRGRGRTVGLLTLYNGAGRGPFPPADLATAREVAGRAGLALDSSRLYRQQRDLAAGLQRSLLTEPVQPDHLQIVVRYIPAAQVAEVGGDWYDAFVQPDGATVLVIGDVIGHDTQAAAAMGQARTLLRGLAAVDHDGPAAVLRKTDEVLQTLRTGIVATAMVGRLEHNTEETAPGGARLRWSNAGHPPAMVIDPDGKVVPLTGERPDLLLGVDPSARRRQYDVVLDRGTTLLLYTDGLVERRDQPLQEGLELLEQTLADLGAHGLGLDELVDQLLTRMLPPRPEDDVALVAVRLHDRRELRPAEAGPNRIPPNVPDVPARSPE